jgi:hypothetical protein
MEFLWLGLALAVGFAAGWVMSGRRSVSEMARFEGRVEELQGRLIRAQRANEALLAEAGNVQDRSIGAAAPAGAERFHPDGALGGPLDGPLDGGSDGVLPDALEEEGYEYVEADELTQIRGIGAVLQDKLYDLGILSYQQIAALTPEGIADIDRALRLRGRILRDDWIGQARRILEESQDQPAESQSRLL